MSTCARCGHELGVGRFCTSCGHPIGAPVPESEVLLRLDDGPLPEQADGARPAWLPAAVGAVLVLVLVALLVALLVSYLGEDEAGSPRDAQDDRASRAAADADPDDEEDRARTPVRNVAPQARIMAPPAAPPTTDLDGTLVGYTAPQLVDGRPETCWRTVGDGSGTTITFTLPRPTTLTRVGLVNGYAKSVANGTERVDWYPFNRRVAAVEWVFDDGTRVTQDLVEVRRMQIARIDPVTTRRVQLRILAVTPPGTGELARDYTAISEVLIAGTRA
jgi:hypothetical protein